jgi:hypothetical protein
MNCDKCKKEITLVKIETYPHKCEKCLKTLCRACDDACNVLTWYDVGDDDQYLCVKCFMGQNTPQENN